MESADGDGPEADDRPSHGYPRFHHDPHRSRDQPTGDAAEQYEADSPFDGEHTHLVAVLGEAPDRLGMQEATEEHDQPTAKPEDQDP